MATTKDEAPIPTPSLVVLVGPPASGKSTWAAANFRPEQVVCADTLRGVVGEHELDLAATDDAFELLDRIVTARLGRGLTTVVDTTGLDVGRRRSYLAAARSNGASAVVVRFETSAAECKRRNRERAHPVPAKALDTMVRKAREVDVEAEGWDLVLTPQPVRTVTKKLAPAVAAESADSATARSALRFGLLVSGFTWAQEPGDLADGVARIGRDAEEAGFESIWFMDHLVQIPQAGRAWDSMPDPFACLAAVAAATSTIRLGVLVSPVTFRPVAVLAKQLATLDVLSGGRVIAGIGAGSSASEHEALGLSFGSAAERLALLRDTVSALRALLGPGGAAYSGPVLQLPSTGLYPRPLQERMPILVGGSGERVTLRIAAEMADACNLFGDHRTVERRIAALRAHCADVGRDPLEVEVTHLGSMLLAADAADLRERIERSRPANLGPDAFAERANAGTIADHHAGFIRLAHAGVDTAIVDVADVGWSGALDPFRALIDRFHWRAR